MAAQIKITRVGFADGVYLNGTVKQGIGLAPKDLEGAQPATLMGLTTVERIDATPAGLVIEMKGRFFLVPWSKVATCELEDPFVGERAEAPKPPQNQQGGRR